MMYITNFCNERKGTTKWIFSTCPNHTKYNKFPSPKILAEMIYINNLCDETKRTKWIFSTCPNQTKYNKFVRPKILAVENFQYTKGLGNDLDH
jgi:hypothetical protein